MIYDVETNSFREGAARNPTTSDTPRVLGSDMSPIEQSDVIAKLARDLERAFTWSDTSRGHDYWSEVMQELETLAESVRRRDLG